MKHTIFATSLAAALAVVIVGAQTPAPQTPAGQQRPTADPYANNPDAGQQQFPLAAPAGKDSGARTTAPAGAVNSGPFDPASWKYGPAFNPPPGTKIWNPVKLKMIQAARSPAARCSAPPIRKPIA